MAIINPSSGQVLGSDHLKVHDVITSDDAAPNQSLVINSDGSQRLLYQPMARMAYEASAQAISTATWTTVVMDDVKFDVLSECDTSSDYDYTATNAGYYLFVGVVRWEEISTADFYATAVRLWKNGSTTEAYASNLCIGGTDSTSGTVKLTQQVTTVSYMAANDTMELQAYHAYGSDVDIYGDNNDAQTYLSIAKLS